MEESNGSFKVMTEKPELEANIEQPSFKVKTEKHTVENKEQKKIF
jgi:hypothetical protein